MSSDAASSDVRLLPARRLNPTAHAYVPALFFGVWSALVLLETEVRWMGDSLPVVILAVVTLPLVWFIAQVAMLKIGILLSCGLLSVWKQPIERARWFVGGVLVILCSWAAWWQIKSGALAAVLLGKTWLAALAAFVAWRLLTWKAARPQ